MQIDDVFYMRFFRHVIVAVDNARIFVFEDAELQALNAIMIIV